MMEAGTLQWGRDLTVADSGDFLEWWDQMLFKLQWGRDLTVADRQHSQSTDTWIMGFNGAAT